MEAAISQMTNVRWTSWNWETKWY